MEEAERFFKEHSIDKLVQELFENDDLLKTDLNTYLLYSVMLSYLYTTPSLHFYLMLKGIVDIDQFETLFNRPSWQQLKDRLKDNPAITVQVESNINICRDYAQHWEESLRLAVAEYFLEGLSRHKFLTMRNVLGSMAKTPREDWLESIAKANEETESFKTDLSFGLSYISEGKKSVEEVYQQLQERASMLNPVKLYLVIMYFILDLKNIVPLEEDWEKAVLLLQTLLKRTGNT
jgi:hypothetical protein